MLGFLVSIILQSWCLEAERNTDPTPYCVTEDLKLLTAGIILVVSVAPAFLNTCLARNINLPHSYQELKKWSTLRSDNRASQEEVELAGVGENEGTGGTAPDA